MNFIVKGVHVLMIEDGKQYTFFSYEDAHDKFKLTFEEYDIWIDLTS